MHVYSCVYGKNLHGSYMVYLEINYSLHPIVRILFAAHIIYLRPTGTTFFFFIEGGGGGGGGGGIQWQTLMLIKHYTCNLMPTVLRLRVLFSLAMTDSLQVSTEPLWPVFLLMVPLPPTLKIHK